jgi:hypothetical protein
VNFGLAGRVSLRTAALQKIEVTTLIRLQHVHLMQGAVAARKTRLGPDQAALRRASSSSGTSRLSLRCGTSSSIRSPL